VAGWKGRCAAKRLLVVSQQRVLMMVMDATIRIIEAQYMW